MLNALSEKERTNPSFAAHFKDESLLQAADDVDIYSATYNEHYERFGFEHPDWSFTMCKLAARCVIIEDLVELKRVEQTQ